MSVTYRLGAISVVAAISLLLGGCSGSGNQPDKTASTPKGVAASSPSTGSSAQTTQNGVGQVAADLAVLGSHKTSAGKTALQIDLNEVRADGQVMTVTWSARNLGPASEKWQVASFFADGIYQEGPDGKSPATETGGPADGVFVIDSKHAKRYLPARDAQANCVCSQGGSNTFIQGGQSVSFQAVFKAPPEDVTTVLVAIPHAGVFSGVKVDR